MAPNLRPRTGKVKPNTYSTTIDITRSPSPTISDVAAVSTADTSTPPVYTIDLSLPPAERYVEVTKAYSDSIKTLQHLFDEVIQSVPMPNWLIHFAARLLLRRIHSAEQTEELRGISQTASVPIYLLVAYNVLLDLFMGCTSGGALVQDPESAEPRMMHFRTLDWDMPALRNVVVQYDFVTRPGGPVVASTISYVGFVGVLTGMRKNVSISLNFRPYHNNDSSMWVNAKFRFHQLAVLLGFRPSIASMLRDIIIPRTLPPAHAWGAANRTIDLRVRTLIDAGSNSVNFPAILSTAAYVILCTPDSTTVFEKDLMTAEVRSSKSFIAVTNHDIAYERDHNEAAHAVYAKKGVMADGMRELVEESVDRKKCLVGKWEKWNRKQRREWGGGTGVPLELLKEWMLAFPTSNEMTHFVCIMDPMEGRIRWVRCFADGEIVDENDEA